MRLAGTNASGWRADSHATSLFYGGSTFNLDNLDRRHRKPYLESGVQNLAGAYPVVVLAQYIDDS
jgi:hypothetical protein